MCARLGLGMPSLVLMVAVGGSARAIHQPASTYRRLADQHFPALAVRVRSPLCQTFVEMPSG